MLSVIVFSGGLGNQMFQYAFYMALKKEHPFSLYVFDIRDSKTCHNGFELFRIFNIKNEINCKGFTLINKFCKSFLGKFHIVKQPYSLGYYPSLLLDKCFFSRYEGFWQSPHYFKSVTSEVHRIFCFNKTMLTTQTSNIAEILRSGLWCSVHVRRGDYLTESFVGVCSIAYYREALAFITKTTGCKNFCFFSDDVDWVKENLLTDHAIYVDWNHKEDSWQDMYLMSQCKHNIIANSSFSWWGAWLNANMNKVVVAPKKWFLNAIIDDIIPDNWVRM